MNTKLAGLLSLSLLGVLLVAFVALVGCESPKTPNAPTQMVTTMAEATPSPAHPDLAPTIKPYYGIRVNGTEARPTFGFKDKWGRLVCEPWYTIEEAQMAAEIQWRNDSRME